MFSPISELLSELKSGKMIVLVDDEDRENEGDLIYPADYIMPETINFMCKEARGLICLAMSPEQIEKLQIPMMIRENKNETVHQTSFTVSIEAAFGVSTGISAKDRAFTIYVASRPNVKPTDVIVPGHIFPLKAKKQGVLERQGHTEASVDLMKLAGLNPSAVICEIMNDDGTMSRVPDLKLFCQKHKIKMGTIKDLVSYRTQKINSSHNLNLNYSL